MADSLVGISTVVVAGIGVVAAFLGSPVVFPMFIVALLGIGIACRLRNALKQEQEERLRMVCMLEEYQELLQLKHADLQRYLKLLDEKLDRNLAKKETRALLYNHQPIPQAFFTPNNTCSQKKITDNVRPGHS